LIKNASEIILSLALVIFGKAMAYAQTRSELPVRAVPLSSGAVLYSVQIKVGATEIEAGLDTGSTGLRIFPGTLADGDATSGSPVAPYGFTSGNLYEGHAATGTVTLGSISGDAPMEVIDNITCARNHSDCPIKHESPSDYGVRGNSLTGGRFRALFGINTVGATPKNPLVALGVDSWIVELPRADEPGRLILNPSAEETKGFIRIPMIAAFHTMGPLGNSVTGCLVDALTKEKTCGPLVLDTGAPIIRLQNSKVSPEILTAGRSVAFVLFDDRGPRAIENIMLGQPQLGTRTTENIENRSTQTVIFSGTAPYQGLRVLYEPSQNQIGVEPRPAIAGVPMPEMVAR